MWQMKTVVIPVVVGALGTIKKGMEERERHCDRDPKDLHAGICANPQKAA